MAPRRIIVAITGATGVIYGIKLLEALMACPEAESHLILSKAAEKIIQIETTFVVDKVLELADYHYEHGDIGAAVASGSYPVYGMAVLPCSMKTLASIAHGLADNLITRAADVTLKEGRKLVLSPRETPLNLIHLENMLAAAKAGACLLPPMPAFYHNPENLEDLVNHLVGRVMDQLELPHNLFKRWEGGAKEKINC
jgi:4-hydroxy-3-polyprenylbenzoate decarboxylase